MRRVQAGLLSAGLLIQVSGSVQAVTLKDSLSLPAQHLQRQELGSCTPGYEIAFLNGMFVTPNAALESQAALFDELKTNKFVFSDSKPIDHVLSFYNYSLGAGAQDASEVIAQKYAEQGHQFTRAQILLGLFGLGVAGVEGLSALLGLADYSIFSQEEAAQLNGQRYVLGDASVKATVDALQGQYLSLLLQGKAVTVVAHSQGNFYINALKAQIQDINNRSTNGQTISPSQLGVVHVATPAGTTSSLTHQFLTYKYDNVMKAVRTLAPDATLPANYDSADYPGSANDPHLEEYKDRDTYLHGFLGGGHNFVDVYLAHSTPNFVTLEPGTAPRRGGVLWPMGQQILRNIRTEVDSTQPNPDLNGGLFTATLTWDHDADVDLHTIEPSGENVYWNHKQGHSGFLDFDDTQHQGPEHYFANCQNPQEGTYTLGTNFYNYSYSGPTGPVSGTLTVSAFGKTYPSVRFTEEAPRGDAGVPSPIPRFLVDVKKTADGYEVNGRLP